MSAAEWCAVNGWAETELAEAFEDLTHIGVLIAVATPSGWVYAPNVWGPAPAEWLP